MSSILIGGAILKGDTIKTLIYLVLAILVLLPNKPIDIPRRASQHVIKLENRLGSGTGFYLMYKGKSYLITNRHVCLALKSNILHVSKIHDLCILKSNRTTGLEISKQNIKPLDKVHVIGHPKGYPLTIRDGRFVSEEYDILMHVSFSSVRIMMISVPVFGGNSGSPVINEAGKVVGVVYASDMRTQEDSVAVPRQDLIDFLDKYINNKE